MIAILDGPPTPLTRRTFHCWSGFSRLPISTNPECRAGRIPTHGRPLCHSEPVEEDIEEIRIDNTMTEHETHEEPLTEYNPWKGWLVKLIVYLVLTAVLLWVAW